MNIFQNELSLLLCPGRAVLQLGQDEPLTLAGPGMDLKGLPILFAHEAMRAGPLRVQISDAWVRYDLIQVDTATMSEDEARILAEARFRRQYGAPLWPLRVAALPEGLLVAGMNPDLLAALETLAQGGKLKLASVEPVFSALLDAASLRRHNGWLLLDEGELLLLAYLDGGKLLSLRSQFCGEQHADASLELLERQAALESRPDKTVLYHALTGTALRLPAPWKIEALQLPVANQRTGLSALLRGCR